MSKRTHIGDEIWPYYARERKLVLELAKRLADEGQFEEISEIVGSGDREHLRDPFIDWLVDGFSYLTGRIQYRLDQELPRFAQHAIETSAPHLLASTPSMLVARFAPDAGNLSDIKDGVGVIPAGSILEAGRDRDVFFRTGRDVVLRPFVVSDVSYAHSANDGKLTISFQGISEGALDECQGDHIDLFLPGDSGASLYRALITNAVEFSAKIEGSPKEFSNEKLRIVPVGLKPGNDPDRPCLLSGHRQDVARGSAREDSVIGRALANTPRGLLALHEYLTLNDSYQFVRIEGLQEVLDQCGQLEAQEFSITTRFDTPHRKILDLSREVLRGSVLDGCTPSINLVELDANGIEVEGAWELVVQHDRDKYQVQTVLSVVERSTGTSGRSQQIMPLHTGQFQSPRTDSAYQFYYTERLRADRMDYQVLAARGSTQEVGQRKGSDTYLFLANEFGKPTGLKGSARGIDARVLASNRKVPEELLSLSEKGSAGHAKPEIMVVAGPTTPRPGILGFPEAPEIGNQTEGNRLWHALSLITANHMSLLGEDGGTAGNLKSLLRLFVDPKSSELVDSITGVALRSENRRMQLAVQQGGVLPVTFVPGLCITIAFRKIEDSAILLADLIGLLLADYAGANSFVEVSISQDDVVNHIFPARSGTRYLAKHE